MRRIPIIFSKNITAGAFTWCENDKNAQNRIPHKRRCLENFTTEFLRICMSKSEKNRRPKGKKINVLLANVFLLFTSAHLMQYLFMKCLWVWSPPKFSLFTRNFMNVLFLKSSRQTQINSTFTRKTDELLWFLLFYHWCAHFLGLRFLFLIQHIFFIKWFLGLSAKKLADT